MRTRKRMIALVVAVVLMAIGVFAYIAVNGGTYTERMDYIYYPFITAEDLSATSSREDIAEVKQVYLDSEHIIHMEFAAKQPGDTVINWKMRNPYADSERNPYLYNATFPLHVTQAGVILQTEKLNFNGYILTEYAIVAGLALICIVCAVTFFEAWKKAYFSYSMVTFGGVALFCLSMIVVVVYGMQWRNDFRIFLINLLNTGNMFAEITAPLMLFISLTVSVSNIWLLCREGFRPQNMLGIALGVLWTALLVPVFIFMPGFRTLDASLTGLIGGGVSYIASFLCCMLLSTMVCAFLASKHTPPFDRDYLVILGCCIRPDGTLTPILKGRADAAIQFEQKQFAATGKHAKFVPSGGQGADEVISEGEAMERYLLEQGYPAEQIIREDKSVNTYQNIAFSRDKIQADAGTLDGVKAGVATTNYHVFRSYVLSQKHGLNAQGISAKTKWYFFPNAFLREFVGLLWDKKIKIALALAGIILLYIIGAQLISFV